ncbi:rhodanese-like domain-containing protein [Cesiribacter andamanensis]|uniref:Putative adenylyltransferase/sulfurtransferase MoeZ n=1 Tax=Cesiribacter andamanensis AMV16 TaxID=1279009 RepID=M7NTS4_9BACT|nr:rhodanese-like domain-containing protein [Cesiribacter andamanensis]EMR01869.1 putative adenylyltransferase/sulfurtransferase MoeZ [Cesiribacter andamanensis AMV16]
MQDISAQELKERLDKGETPYILDVREEWEFEEDNLGGQLIPLATLPAQIGEVKANKDEEVVVHCRSGKRSATAKKILEQNGFTQVRNLEGGILAYREL